MIRKKLSTKLVQDEDGILFIGIEDSSSGVDFIKLFFVKQKVTGAQRLAKNLLFFFTNTFQLYFPNL
jgi:hypothetical protein